MAHEFRAAVATRWRAILVTAGVSGLLFGGGWLLAKAGLNPFTVGSTASDSKIQTRSGTIVQLNFAGPAAVYAWPSTATVEEAEGLVRGVLAEYDRARAANGRDLPTRRAQAEVALQVLGLQYPSTVVAGVAERMEDPLLRWSVEKLLRRWGVALLREAPTFPKEVQERLAGVLGRIQEDLRGEQEGHLTRIEKQLDAARDSAVWVLVAFLVWIFAAPSATRSGPFGAPGRYAPTTSLILLLLVTGYAGQLLLLMRHEFEMLDPDTSAKAVELIGNHPLPCNPFWMPRNANVVALSCHGLLVAMWWVLLGLSHSRLLVRTSRWRAVGWVASILALAVALWTDFQVDRLHASVNVADATVRTWISWAALPVGLFMYLRIAWAAPRRRGRNRGRRVEGSQPARP